MTLAQHHEGLGPGRAQSSSGASADRSVGQHGRLLGKCDVRIGPTRGPRARGASKLIHAAAPMHVLPTLPNTQNSHPKRAWLGIEDGARILLSAPPPTPRQFKHQITSQPTKKTIRRKKPPQSAARKKYPLARTHCSEPFVRKPQTRNREGPQSEIAIMQTGRNVSLGIGPCL